MKEKNLKSVAINSVIWKLLDKFGTQIISFIVQIILARLLLPSEYGMIAIVSIFINIGNVFVHGGFNMALVQKKDVDELDYSSVFFLCFIISIILYILLFFTSPIIQNFYGFRNLSTVLRILSISLIFNSISTVQVAYVTKNYLFKKHFISNIFSAIISGIISIILAYQGFGIWSLVIYQLLTVILNSIFLLILVAWHPKKLFSFKRIKNLLSYGIKLLFSSLINIVFKNIHGLVIGKIYTSTDLGLYNKANQFPSLLSDNIDGSISTVLFPILAEQQNDRGKMKSTMKRMIKVNSFIVFPILLGLIAVAEPLVRILLTEKWLPCVPFIQLLSITYILYPIHTTNLQAINAIGRSDAFLKLEIIKKILVIVSVIISSNYGIYVMIYFQIITSIISSFINSSLSKKEFGYGIIEQWGDIIKTLIISGLMLLAVSIFKFFITNMYILLLIQVLFGIFIYMLLSYLFNRENFKYILDIVGDLKNKIIGLKKKEVI